jgi:hypothetical protein
VRILRELSPEIATPDDARRMLALKGAARTQIPVPANQELAARGQRGALTAGDVEEQWRG